MFIANVKSQMRGNGLRSRGMYAKRRGDDEGGRGKKGQRRGGDDVKKRDSVFSFDRER
jgi:hypothetical protein